MPKILKDKRLSSEQNMSVVDENRHINIDILILRRNSKMSKNKIMVPEAKQAMENFKMEAAREVGVDLKQGYNGDLTSRQAGSVGGQMVKNMIKDYENKIKA